MNIKSYLTVTTFLVFLSLYSVAAICLKKYSEQKLLNAAQSLQITGLTKYVSINEAFQIKALESKSSKSAALDESYKRIGELEKLLEMDVCFNARINSDADKRLRQRVNSIRNPATTSSQSNG